MKILGVIPARYASTRFPGKPLVVIEGKTMIQRVYEQAARCPLLTAVCVATDNQAIYNHVRGFGGRVVMTREDHRSGTDRCGEVLSILSEAEEHFDAVVNIQGDEPFIDPDQIAQVASILMEQGEVLVTLVRKITETELLTDENVVKVAIARDGRALYFSRSAIPFTRGRRPAEWLSSSCYHEHVGIYGYPAGLLSRIITMQPTPLEVAESLEQLRWLENGLTIRTAVTTYPSVSIDTPADLLKITNRSGISR